MDSLSIGVLAGVGTVALVAGGMKLYVLGYRHATEYASQQLDILKKQFTELKAYSAQARKDVPCVGWIAVVQQPDGADEKANEIVEQVKEKARQGEVEELEEWWKREGGEER